MLSPPPTLAMALLPEGGVEQVIDVLEAQAARAIFTERSDKEELHKELFPALQTSQSTPNISKQSSASSSRTPLLPRRGSSPLRSGTASSTRSSRWFETRGSDHGDELTSMKDHDGAMRDLGLQRRTKMMEKQRWRNQKNSITTTTTTSSSPQKKKKKTKSDWRKDPTLSTDDTPSLTHDLSRMTMDKKWTAQYEQEKAGFASEALHNEVRLREVFAQTEGMGTPNIQRTAVCSELLWSLSSKFGRFKELHGLLVLEIFRSAYHNFDDDVSARSHFNVADFLRATPYYELIDGLQAEVRKLRFSLKKLTSLRDEVEIEAGKRNKVFMMAIHSWQTQVLRRMFQNWVAGANQQKRTRQLLRLRRLRIWFDAFKKRWLKSTCAL